MSLTHLAHFIFLVYLGSVSGEKDGEWSFPDGFLLGTATSSYQVEGAWNVSDKGESVWDRFVHSQPHKIFNGDNGDIACDSYHQYKTDIQLMKSLGVDYYRFSISWPRILPTGYANVISKDGVNYYNNLLDELERNNITPVVTIYHWDHPQKFQDIGGWTNEAMVDLFGDYARVVFQEFGHRVKTFITINEPNVVCESEYFNGNFAPGLKIGKHAEYLCTHNMIKAHARAYHIYNDEFRSNQRGKIGIVVSCDYYYSKHENDTESSEVAFQYQCGRYGGPIFSKNGDYPEIVRKRVAENSQFEGLKRSRLPVFSKQWIDYIKGSADFFGLNHYTTKLVEPAPRPANTIYLDDHGLIYDVDPKWPTALNGTLRIVPEGFRDVLRKIQKEYNNVTVYVTENGVSDDGTLNDDQRIQYLHGYIKAMLTAIKEYNCNVRGYTVWSLMDNFEWNSGYSLKFGIFHVDFNDPERKRSAKKSVSWFSKVLRTRKLIGIPASDTVKVDRI